MIESNGKRETRSGFRYLMMLWLVGLLLPHPAHAASAQISARPEMHASAKVGASFGATIAPRHYEVKYHVVARRPDGSIAWTRDFHNMLTTAGANKYLDATLKTGLASPAWYVGLIKAYTGGSCSASLATGDTLGSHSLWTEVVLSTDVTNSSRPAWTPGTISSGSVDNSGSVAVYTGNGSITLYGLFLADASTGTTGTLLGEGCFSTSAAIQSGYTVNVTATATITAG